jgi:hypothetical protein
MSDVLTPDPLAGTSPSPNGHVDEPFEAKLLADLDGAIREKRDRMLALEADRAAIDERLAEQRAALKRYEDTRKRLVGEPLRVNRGPYAKRGPKPSPSAARARPVSAERMEAVRQCILRFAEDHDEFAQVDIRSMPDAPVTHSGNIAHAFEALRQDGFIRFARQDGLKKLYRLTRSAVAES